MTPQCRITIDGRLASGVFSSRVISCEVTDKEGVSSDTVSIELNDDPPAAIPRKGAIIRVWMGYLGATVFMGSFAADEIEVQFKPYKMTITGRSADLRKVAKQNRERHWDDKTLGEIVEDIAGRNGLTAKVDSTLGVHRYTWLGQQGESDLHFLERLADRHGALFSVKDGNLIFAARGTGRSPTGVELTPIVVRLADLVEGSGRARFADRAQYKAVTATYQDPDRAERVEVAADSDAEGEAIYRLAEPFADGGEAVRAAEAKAKALRRNGTTFACDILGNPAARAGAPLSFQAVRPGVDGLRFIIGTARHRYGKDSYVTGLEGESA